MKMLKRILKWIGYVLLLPITYVVISLLLTVITVERKTNDAALDKTIYLSTNGVHLDIVLPREAIDPLLLADLKQQPSDAYLGFGWGDENFYLNTPTWGDLTLKTAVSAMFLKSSTLMHVTRHRNKRSDWVAISVSSEELVQINAYLLQSFTTNAQGQKILLVGQGYTPIDDFYEAQGSYSCFKTCNSWVNTGFKQSRLKAALWTPFDFGLLSKY